MADKVPTHFIYSYAVELHCNWRQIRLCAGLELQLTRTEFGPEISRAIWLIIRLISSFTWAYMHPNG